MLTERRKKKKVLDNKEVKDQAKFTLLLVQKAKTETLNLLFEYFPFGRLCVPLLNFLLHKAPSLLCLVTCKDNISLCVLMARSCAVLCPHYCLSLPLLQPQLAQCYAGSSEEWVLPYRVCSARCLLGCEGVPGHSESTTLPPAYLCTFALPVSTHELWIWILFPKSCICQSFPYQSIQG